MKRFHFAVTFAIVFLCFSFLASMVMKSFSHPIGEGPAFVVAISVLLLSIVITKKIIKKM